MAGRGVGPPRQTIRNRSENLTPPDPLTVKRLAQDETFLAVVTELRTQGWKDSHPLTVVANIVVNARATASGLSGAEEPGTQRVAEADGEIAALWRAEVREPRNMATARITART